MSMRAMGCSSSGGGERAAVCRWAAVAGPDICAQEEPELAVANIGQGLASAGALRRRVSSGQG